MDHKNSLRTTCPYCGGKGTLRMPWTAARAVHDLAAPTLISKMLEVLADRFGRWVPISVLLDEMYDDTGRDGSRLSLRVFASTLRKKLLPYDLMIEASPSYVTESAYRLGHADYIDLPDSGWWLPKRRAYDGPEELPL